MSVPLEPAERVVELSPADQHPPFAKRWRHAPSIWLQHLRSHEPIVLAVLLLVTFLAHFYAADLKGVWNDDAVRLTIANGGLPTADVGKRQPGHAADVIRSIGRYAVQPAYPLLVNGLLRLTRSYSIIPIVTTNSLIFLFSAVGIYLLARRLLTAGPRLIAVLLYLWNGFAMVHVLQVREYPLILFFLVYNMLFFYRVLSPSLERRGWRFWFVVFAYYVSCVGAFYTTKWTPFLVWPEAVIALFWMGRKTFRSLTVLGVLVIAALSCLPSVLSIQESNVVFQVWDKRTPSLSLLFSRLHVGTEHLLVGSLRPHLSFLEIYYWGLLLIALTGLAIFGFRFFRERIEVQHIVLTIVGFLAFQISYFFLREPLSTWPRYFILYLPYVVLLIPLTISRTLVVGWRRVPHRTWAYSIFILIVATAGCAQISSNYRNPKIDHGPDFREVYRYLIVRVAPRDIVVVRLSTNRMALSYYWPNPAQIRHFYRFSEGELQKAEAIWTVTYRDGEDAAYAKWKERLRRKGFVQKDEDVVAGVTLRRFSRGAKVSAPLLPR